MVNENLQLKIGLAESVNISSKTAQRWLNILGLRFGKFMKGLYKDGHERDDVVKYRNAFLQRMFFYEKRMVRYVGNSWRSRFPQSLKTECALWSLLPMMSHVSDPMTAGFTVGWTKITKRFVPREMDAALWYLHSCVNVTESVGMMNWN